MLRTAVILLGSLRTTLAADNGLALLPPMGWRSWNTYYASIDATKISAQIDALAAMRDKATGAPSATGTVSLLSLGYESIGIDEGWEGCGLGVNGTVHYVNGTPAVDPQRFPDMPGLVKYGHSKGVEMGFYLNGCGCNERSLPLPPFGSQLRLGAIMGNRRSRHHVCQRAGNREKSVRRGLV